jgi:hypothetical protein
MKKLTLVALALVFAGALHFLPSASAQPTVVSGKVVILAADPGDFVIQLDTNGPCKSAYFHVQRAAQNFKEMTAIALTAFSNGKTMTLFVASCSGDRNILSHGYIGR